MLSSGSILGGRYQIVRAIGRGGMGEVYEAMQLALARRVAVKTIRADLATNPALLARFRREAESAAALGHPNLVQVTDFQASPGEPAFLVMEMLDGATLKDVMEREGRLDPARASFIAVQLLAGLAAAHRAGIIHRDVKPGNVFLQSTSAMRDIVKVLDFGVAKLALEATPNAKAMTQAGQILGTLTYMAPEQGFSGAAIDARTDVFAVGATLFHAVSGVRHLDAVQPGGGRTPLEQLAPWVHRDLAAVIERALQRSPDNRWQSADDMAAALQPFASAPRTSTPPSNPQLDPGRAQGSSGGWDPAAIGRLEAPTGGGSSFGGTSPDGSSFGDAPTGAAWNGYAPSAVPASPMDPSQFAPRDATLLGHGARPPGAHEMPPPVVPSPGAFAPAYAPAASGAAPAGAVPYVMPPPMAPPGPSYGPPPYPPYAQPYGAQPTHPSHPGGGLVPVGPRRGTPPWWIAIVVVIVLAFLVPYGMSFLAIRNATNPDTIATNVEREVLKQPRQPCPSPDQCKESREEHGLTYPLCTRKLPSLTPYKAGEFVLAGPDARIAIVTTGEQSGHRYGVRFLTAQSEQTIGDDEIIGRLCRTGARAGQTLP